MRENKINNIFHNILAATLSLAFVVSMNYLNCLLNMPNCTLFASRQLSILRVTFWRLSETCFIE
jgi:hypothetical protein